MSVRFKFWSCAAVDSFDLRRSRYSTSVRERRAKIMRKKNLKPCQEFVLVLPDSLTEEVLEDDDLELPEGSSITIKRVLAWMSGSQRLGVKAAIAEATRCSHGWTTPCHVAAALFTPGGGLAFTPTHLLLNIYPQTSGCSHPAAIEDALSK